MARRSTVDPRMCICREVQTDRRWRRYYANFLQFFTGTVARLGVGVTLEQYVFSPVANGDGAYMLLRFVGGA